MLRSSRDLQSLVYLAALPALLGWQWWHGFSLPAYALALFLTLGVGVIHHNHCHLPMWRSRRANRVTDFVVTLLQGHPSFVFHPAHRANHHRYRHGPKDAARTYRFAGGDTNHLLGYLLHPLQAACVLYPLFVVYLARLRRHSPGAHRYCLAQCAAVLAFWGALACASPGKALLYVLVPQLHGLHWLLATNYLQHAHADGQSRIDYARNFTGLLNPLLFNIGFHTAHHEHPRAHWSELTKLHRQWQGHLKPELSEPSLIGYMLRVFVLAPLFPRWRSRSLMHRSG